MLTVEELQNSTPTDWSTYDQDLRNRSSGDSNRFKDDDKLHVRFYSAPVIDQTASEAANRAIYKQAEMIEIMMPGDKNNIIREQVWDQYRQRFAAKYALFKKGLSQDIGSPLNALPFLDESRIKELEFFNIKTVEQLAGMADAVKQRFMGADRLSQQAKEWLDHFNSGDSLRKALDEQAVAMDAKLDEAQAQNTALQERLMLLEARLNDRQVAQQHSKHK